MKVVFFNGPPRCGKDTFADWGKNNYPKAERHAFADQLKLITHRFFIDDMNHAAMKNPKFFESVKDVPMPLFGGMSPRQAYIWISEDVCKPKFGVDYFGKILVRKIKDEIGRGIMHDWIFISDSGFYDEMKAFRDIVAPEDMILIRLHRPGTNFSGDSRSYLKPTNTPQYDVQNDEGQLAATTMAIHEILKHHM